ncbi:MAG: hypothetical protein IT564_11440 [Rhodospirillales bacterium]|nr:hypothetical protein [Rhodospirillales bacterium]
MLVNVDIEVLKTSTLSALKSDLGLRIILKWVTDKCAVAEFLAQRNTNPVYIQGMLSAYQDIGNKTTLMISQLEKDFYAHLGQMLCDFVLACNLRDELITWIESLEVVEE